MGILKEDNRKVNKNHHHMGSYRDYIIGFFLSVFLTIIPFGIVIFNVFQNQNVTIFIILVLGSIQVIVHLIYFLHMSPKSEDGWSIAAMIFTAIVIIICFVGSVWVMYHLNNNMMPVSNGMMHKMH
ncbi:Cytochrome O ubiquinol oxidase subunit IV [Liberibacter crescens BT-1]|uniref:Cytochrome bo(3) ubiquinol oxidase subunit 4 n=1 Tax=Liberibacter crescens (strain BT-1) TaxID=1215343 RepID=L0ET15_LIBCB|nr:cytochrome o ubiquinol oxidase subunit IV [Liberibacter crescens]AGA64077.1 Cytochrome O ubiquinol oxidase subunit IV [Liberibacter crescens BT-1]AMC12366.1 cytochrome O ubiquinol oxidase [Liberibacter crescens]